MFHTYLDALFEKWMRQHGASAACDPTLRAHTDDLWRAGQPRDAHPTRASFWVWTTGARARKRAVSGTPTWKHFEPFV